MREGVMNIALSTKWINAILSGPLPPNFYLEIRALTPGGKRTQFTYIPIQEFFAAAVANNAALESTIENVVSAMIDTAVQTKIDEAIMAGNLGNSLSSTNW